MIKIKYKSFFSFHDFALTVYPININGPHDGSDARKRNIKIESAYSALTPSEPLKSLEVMNGYPVLVDDSHHREDIDDVIWNVKWPPPTDPHVTGDILIPYFITKKALSLEIF